MRRHRGVLIGLAILLVPALAAGLWLCFWLFHDLPTPDRFGTYIAQQGGSSQYAPVPLSEIPPALRWAAVVTEDPTFYDQDFGHIPLVSLLRAIRDNLDPAVLSDPVGVTAYLVGDLNRVSGRTTPDRARRRMRSMALCILITRRYTHDEILEFYLNSRGYGNMVYGAEAAAQYYFGKHVRDLDLAECAMLQGAAASGQARFSPLASPEEARGFQELVLNRMVVHGYIDEEEARRAQEEPLIFAH